MDLSIRVIALILFATCVASHQGTHTYRLFKFLKIATAPFLSIRLQQRSEIMKHFLHLVKHFLTSFFLPTSPSLPPETPAAAKRANYIHTKIAVKQFVDFFPFESKHQQKAPAA
ncbi:hypothetical protein KI614_12885 [Dechloromonas denitrificans]|uniref:hypothetical protein n=1 Tax=Dechloromonas denitrificans TaxID=281362 RepID=UPI001CF8B6EF|nr:hypothetical protein [Dechloromonas denitrificans]UCV11045.1 hypothetical protein KI614_12885 [Dechloromonas denitrificans]